jgi:cytosine/adenosine deaminase-related metal-dependent hydrolase
VIYRARWVLPVDHAPIAGGWVETHGAGGAVNVDERITRIGQGPPPGSAEDLGDVALLPGLVNAHTHLELAWMAGLVPPSGSMDDWIRTLLAVRRAGPSGGEPEILTAMTEAADEMRATGTVLAGDISNSLVSPSVLIAAGIGGVVFHEILGFSQSDPAPAVRDAWQRVEAQPAGLRYSVVAHAPYSVSRELFVEIAARAGAVPLSVHLGESAEEIEFLRTGRGPIRTMLESLGVWTDEWRIPECDPVTYMADVGYLVEGALLVHGVHLTDDGLEKIRRAKAVLVTCPRSNLWVGAGPPRLSHFFASGAPVAIGTDSLASAPTLNMFDELAEMRRMAPELAAPTLLDSATRRGAVALGFGRDYGTLAPGKRAALVAVDVPPSERDVEEYLVSGVSAGAIRRVA